MKKKVGIQLMVVFFLLSFALAGCKYYQVRTYSNEKTEITEVLTEKNINQEYWASRRNLQYFVHVGEQYWTLKDAKFTGEGIVGSELAPVHPISNLYYQQAINGAGFRVKSKYIKHIDQVHLYADQLSVNEDSSVYLPLNAVNHVNLLKNNAVKNGAIVLLVTGTLTVAAAGGFLLIACNCPHVYTFDGEKYHYNNTLFTGATSPSIERNDFKPLPDYYSESDSYKLMIKNEEDEIHHTNLLELKVVNHPLNSEVFPNQQGEIFTVSNKQAPSLVYSHNQTDLKPILGFDDDNGYAFDEVSAEDYADIYAVFDKPKNTENVKLILKAKNTAWSGFVHNEFIKMFGRRYDEWQKKLRTRSAQEVNAYRKSAGIPLVVSVKYNNEWVDIETINLIGDVNYNSLVVEVDQRYITDGKIEVRLRSGFKFWNVDYVMLDASEPQDLVVQTVKPVIVTTNGVKDEQLALSADDNNYVTHENNGDSTLVIFESLNTAGETNRSLFLRSKGYYLTIDEFEGRPNRSELKKFREVGELSRYSKLLYKEHTEGYTQFNKTP